jgi:predicted nucleic acid-binding protein
VARIVLFYACVLSPAPLRDFLMRLALTDLFQARWSDQIHDEWTRNLLANRPELTAENLTRCRRLMDAHVPDCLVTGYESLTPTLSLPDPDDRHMLATAIHGGAGLIITYNLSDFPAPALGQFEIEILHPDEFIVRNWDLPLT